MASKAQESVSQAFRSNMESNPKRDISSTAANANQMADRQRNGFIDMFGSLLGVGLEAMNSNPMMKKMGAENPFGGLIAGLSEMLNAGRPQVSPYESRIRTLMDKGMTRDEATANQNHAKSLGTDYNKDGHVTDDEWRQYKASGGGQPMHYGSMGGGVPQIGGGVPQIGTWAYKSPYQR